MKPAVSDAPLHICLSIVGRMRIEGELGHRLWCIRHVHRTMHRKNGQAFDKRLETEPAFRPLRRCYGFAASFLTDMFHKFGYACDRLGLNIRRRRTSLNRNEAAADEGIKTTFSMYSWDYTTNFPGFILSSSLVRSARRRSRTQGRTTCKTS